MKNIKKMNVLIIGSSSFIAKRFIQKYSTDFNFKFVTRTKTELNNEIVLKDFFQITESILLDIDVIINFAAIVHNPRIKDKSIYESINYKLPIYLASIALKMPKIHFIQMSSIAVYGEQNIINSNTKCAPSSIYGTTKLEADNQLLKLNNEHLKITILRPSMVYGIKNAPGNMNLLIRLVRTGIPLPFKSIENSRQFLHIDNLSNALKSIIDQNLYGVIILADEESISTNRLIDLISKKMNLKSRNFRFSLFWKFLNLVTPNLVRKLTSDLLIKNTYSFSELNINKRYSIENGINNMINK